MIFAGWGFAALAALAAATQCPMDYARHLDPATDTALFVSCIMFWEGRILEAAYWDVQGLTRDGSFVYPNGTLGPPHLFSAPSKESLHLGVLARALAGDDVDALTFVVARKCDETGSLEACQAMAKQNGRSEALDQLSRKVGALERFNEEFPGYGGFLPWFTVNASGSLVPLGGWEQRIPALDNGEMIWGLIAVAEALTSDDSGVGARVEALLAVLAANAKAAFYDGWGRVRAVSRVVNPNAKQPTASNFVSDGAGYLVDPYEGELFTQFLCLFGAGVTADEADLMWLVKRAMLREVTSSGGSVQRGWWFSSHEQWKYLFAPYRDVAINWQLFVNGEMARTQHSRGLGIGGLFASVNNVTLPGAPFAPAYYSANGIPELAFQGSDCCGTTVTPYASFSVMLANRTVGLAWWASVTAGSRMQSRFGSLESVLADGALYCPLVTWDAKITSVLAALGGAEDLCRSYLQRQGVYEAFANRVQHEWSLAFPNVSSGVLAFALPIAPIS